MNKRKPALFLSTVMLMSLSGCANKNTDGKDGVSEDNSVYFYGNSSLSQNIIFCKSGDSDDERLYAWDLNSGSYTIFCSAPNCAHNFPDDDPNTTCTAVGFDAKHPEISEAFIYEDSLYEICMGGINECEIYKSDTDGQNRSDYGTIEIGISDLCNPVLSDGSLVFVGCEYNTDELESDDLESEFWVCSYDIENRTLNKLADIGATDEVSPDRILHCAGGKIHLGYLTAISQSSDNYEYECKIISVDVDTGDISEILTEDDAGICGTDGEDFLYRICNSDETESTIYKYDTESGESTELFNYDGYAGNVYILDNNAVFTASKGDDSLICMADLGTDEISEYTLSDGEYISIDYHTDKGFVVFCDNSDKDIYDFAVISDKDMLSLNFENMDYRKSE